MLSIVDNMMLAEKKMLSTAAGSLSLIDISLREIFVSHDSWELATLIVSCLGKLIKIGWSCTLHNKICTYKEEVCVRNREKTKVKYTDRYCLRFVELN